MEEEGKRLKKLSATYLFSAVGLSLCGAGAGRGRNRSGNRAGGKNRGPKRERRTWENHVSDVRPNRTRIDDDSRSQSTIASRASSLRMNTLRAAGIA